MSSADTISAAADPLAPLPPPRRGGVLAFLADVRDALRGVHHDYTQGSLGRAILLLAAEVFALVSAWLFRAGRWKRTAI